MRVGIMGLGYVGLALAVCFAEEGHDVVGVDIDASQDRGACRRRVH
jgi:UDP-N-acetyl-D-mannosaminuronate dehydrogenase